jgi:hypothetical protein
MNADFEVYSFILFMKLLLFLDIFEVFFEFWSHFFEIFRHKLDCLFPKKLRLSAHVKKWKCRNAGIPEKKLVRHR